MRTPLLLSVLAAVSLAACGGSTSAATPATAQAEAGTATSAERSTTNSTDEDATDEDATDEDKARAFADCMRDNGVDDFPDPTVDADGTVSFGVGPGGGGGGGVQPPAFLNDPDFQEAADECQPLTEGASFLPGGGDGTDLQDTLLEAAECLRKEGIEVDDPKIDGGLPAGGAASPFGEDFDPEDPATADAIEACQSVFAEIRPGGGN
jgi:hypothetical protein